MMADDEVDEVPVLIVGGGPVGLTAAVALARHGIRSLLVERHPSTSIHPRARVINVRTMEIFRDWGMEPSVREAGRALANARDAVWMTSLNGRLLRRIPAGGDPARIGEHSPTTFCACTQDALEPLLLAQARRLGLTEVRFGQQLVAFEQNATGVAATLLDRDTQRQGAVRARYLIAADGVTSAIRQALGIQMMGHGVYDHRVGIYFTADLADLVRDRAAWVYFIRESETAPASGVFGAVNNADRWVFMARYDPQRGERAEDFTTARCIEMVRRAVGIPDLPVAIGSVLPWTIGQEVAERFRAGRVFLAGDAAHVIPPTGGEAMNVGIHDAHNLAWKLAAVLSGWAGEGEALLDTYEAERLPAARFVGEQALANAAQPRRPESFNNEGQVLGVAYQSAAVLPDGTPPPEVADPVADYVPTGRPGHRAPHVWLERAGQRISTLDLFDTTFVLLAGPAGRAWCEAARAAAGAMGVPLQAYTVGQGGDLGDLGDAAGAVGSYAAQLAHVKGAHVIGTASPRNLDLAREHGVDEVWDYTSTILEDVVQNVDSVFDTVGGETQERSWRLLKPGGVLVSIVAPPVVEWAGTHGARGIFFVVTPSQTQLVEIGRLIDAGLIQPVVEAVYPLDHAHEAYARAETGGAHGKIVPALVS